MWPRRGEAASWRRGRTRGSPAGIRTQDCDVSAKPGEGKGGGGGGSVHKGEADDSAGVSADGRGRGTGTFLGLPWLESAVADVATTWQVVMMPIKSKSTCEIPHLQMGNSTTSIYPQIWVYFVSVYSLKHPKSGNWCRNLKSELQRYVWGASSGLSYIYCSHSIFWH